METITWLYILNATLLLLHEMESAFEKEWEILKLPGGVTGFLLLHLPLIPIFILGAIEIHELTRTGWILGLLTGLAGVIPIFVHLVLFPHRDRFHRTASRLILYGNLVTGFFLAALSIQRLTLP